MIIIKNKTCTHKFLKLQELFTQQNNSKTDCARTDLLDLPHSMQSLALTTTQPQSWGTNYAQYNHFQSTFTTL
jgi:hypothetical protein